MKYNIIVLLIILSSCSISSKLSRKNTYLISRINNQNIKHEHDSVKRKGYIPYYSKSGDLDKIVKYKNNLKNGSYILYYSNGKIRELGKYRNDLLTGNNYQLFENGNIKRISKFKRGLYNGSMTYFNNQGIRIGKGKCKNNVWDGKWIKYDDCGNEMTYLLYGSKLKISDYHIKLESPNYIWELFEKVDNGNYSSYEIRCISKIDSKKDLIVDKPQIFIDFFNESSSTDKPRFENYKVDVKLEGVEIVDSYYSGYISENGNLNKYLVFELRAKNQDFVINAYYKNESFLSHENMILDLLSNLSTY